MGAVDPTRRHAVACKEDQLPRTAKRSRRGKAAGRTFEPDLAEVRGCAGIEAETPASDQAKGTGIAKQLSELAQGSGPELDCGIVLDHDMRLVPPLVAWPQNRED